MSTVISAMTATDANLFRGAGRTSDELLAVIAGLGRLDAVVLLGDQWVVTGDIPYEGTVMLARFPSYERARAVLAVASALSSAVFHFTASPRPGAG
jgi:hypothetical protein